MSGDQLTAWPVAPELQRLPLGRDLELAGARPLQRIPPRPARFDVAARWRAHLNLTELHPHPTVIELSAVGDEALDARSDITRLAAQRAAAAQAAGRVAQSVG